MGSCGKATAAEREETEGRSYYKEGRRVGGRGRRKNGGLAVRIFSFLAR